MSLGIARNARVSTEENLFLAQLPETYLWDLGQALDSKLLHTFDQKLWAVDLNSDQMSDQPERPKKHRCSRPTSRTQIQGNQKHRSPKDWTTLPVILKDMQSRETVCHISDMLHLHNTLMSLQSCPSDPTVSTSSNILSYSQLIREHWEIHFIYPHSLHLNHLLSQAQKDKLDFKTSPRIWDPRTKEASRLQNLGVCLVGSSLLALLQQGVWSKLVPHPYFLKLPLCDFFLIIA